MGLIQTCPICGKEQRKDCKEGIVDTGLDAEGAERDNLHGLRNYIICPSRKTYEREHIQLHYEPCPLGDECPICHGTGIVVPNVPAQKPILPKR